ncbi:PAAR domain-containing protein [Paraburkholderia bannensis]|nr:PAAR domain-containing protein [Paraburkholderia bannensis]
MLNAIRLGDSTDHGGQVITASATMKLRGKGVARKGDRIQCPKHPDFDPNVIEEGDPNIRDHGIPVARDGHHGTCGCSLISSIE